jgi:hypothetical protein
MSKDHYLKSVRKVVLSPSAPFAGTFAKQNKSTSSVHVLTSLPKVRKRSEQEMENEMTEHFCPLRIEQQPILIYQTDDSALATPESRGEKCTCSDVQHDHHQVPLLAQQDEAGGLLSHSSMMTSDRLGSSLPPNGIQQQSALMVDTSFSWAVVTPTPEESLFANDDSVNLGFIFHKSSSQRFLEGQPRPPRKKSVKKQQQQPLSASSSSSQTSKQQQQRSSSPQSCNMNPILPTTMECSQQNFMLPMMDLDLQSPSSGSDNGVLTADLAMILNNVLKPLEQQPFKSEEEMMNHELANLELTQNASMMMYPTSSSSTTAASTSSTPGTPPYPPRPQHLLQQQQQLASYLSNDGSTASSSTTSSSNGTLPQQPQQQQAFDQVGCCGGYTTQCRSDGPGESVVITIAPLSATTNNPLQGSENVRTRIVTCYCSGNCTCPGCLVHPGNFLAGDPFMDPYRGLSTCPSSTASSIYSASDDEDHHQQQQQPSILL